ncbi:unnamed protein product, partial [Allacma fusca]
KNTVTGISLERVEEERLRKENVINDFNTPSHTFVWDWPGTEDNRNGKVDTRLQSKFFQDISSGCNNFLEMDYRPYRPYSISLPSITEIESKWLHWQQSFGGLTGNPIQTRIVHFYPLNYLEGYKNLQVDLTLSQMQAEESFWNLALVIKTNRDGDSASSTHYHYLSLDRCAVRVFLKGVNGKRITRWVHMNCSRLVMTSETPESVVLATFKNPCFISDDVLKELRSDVMGLPTDEFGEIEIHGRLKVCCWHIPSPYVSVDYNNCQINEGFENWFDQDLSLTIRPKMFSNSFNLFSEVGSEDADIKFVMEYDSTKILTAHSFVLAAQSPVLRKMLTIDMVEKRIGVITITDASYSSFELFLNLLYGSKTIDDLLQLPASEVLKILALAHKYQVDYLLRISCMVIMTYENEDLEKGEIRGMYHAGSLFHLPDLEYRAFQWLKWWRDLAHGEGWKETSLKGNRSD